MCVTVKHKIGNQSLYAAALTFPSLERLGGVFFFSGDKQDRKCTGSDAFLLFTPAATAF